MTTLLYVGNLPLAVTEQSLTSKFNRFGTVIALRLSAHPTTGRTPRCAFVEMGTAAEAQRAINGLHFAEYDGRLLTVHRALGATEVKS
jgi:RNA recognition motif-containing protein